MELASELSLPTLPVETLEFASNPDPFLEQARAGHPWLAKFSQGYVVHGYDELCELFTDDVNLLPGFGPVIDFYGVRGTMWARFMEEIVIAVGGDTHKRLRSSVIHAFTPRRANREREMMQRVISGMLDEWAPKGAFDFAEFSSYFPVSVMCGLLGVSTEPIPRMRDALENQLKSLTMDQAAKPLFMAGWEVLWDFADTTVNEREASGEFDEDSLLDAIIAAKKEGKLDETEARFLLLTVVVAGYDTSKNQLSVTMNLLLDRPEMYQRCAEDLQFCRAVTEESLRHTAIASPVRTVADDFTYEEFTFSKGDMLVMAPPLANRDASKFLDPGEFDPERDNKDRHVAFGRGEHICLGQFLARNQLQEGLHLITQRLRNPRRTGKAEWRPFLGAWGPRTLPITFDPA
ncbi:MAG: cytochrome P450 [Novosphingobium sp.]|nr:cytochrome P450 [Novosphingobium sp.]